ncbi:tRNA lysidine(34) synthetase TilS [Bordetella avium]|uniref:tRNA lysidine(34) synthetase TilS n=1 Tax=Bordetella avium TaxID=521 RepID=UPI000E68FDEE|nr:tRNA lysidine(34) synthetase TilS [Bordetella avium]AZY53282.1 tRNA lysidine(34) synthetase TilS [Bordetella avium]RIQ17271.1 tRNA lysidine(34) synthetase TilS [Bordetella avium]RIQ33755.1 tRNA lysidine(34) synthetase TilS [Bordetella avium]RIQ68494.1 tRNA lysidine(34) synthetase TilS [Bordetella avium]
MSPDLYAQVLGPALLGPVRATLARLPPQAPVALALSAGADSAMLAVAARLLAPQRPLLALHVHHGLQAQADEWAQRAQALGGLLELPVRIAHVKVPADGSGIEAAARTARYAALAAMAREAGAGHVLLAHHRDDQAETVLLRLLRGAGVEGMAAMREESPRDGLLYLRPWLDLDRAAIVQAAQAFAALTGWQAVQDPSNVDPRYTRAAVRATLAPLLNARWPGWQAIVSRHARQMGEAVEILREVAREDYARLEPDEAGFALAPWRELSPPRQAQVLRYWLGAQGLRMPSEARLRDLMRQLRQLHALGHDRQLRVAHEGHEIRCHRGRVWLAPAGARKTGA